MGDMIEITESRPISKTKNWVVTRLVEKAVDGLIPATSRRRQAETAHNVGRFSFIRSISMIKVGDTLPAATLQEYSEVEGNGCSIGPNPVDVAEGDAPARPSPCSRCPAPSRPPARPSTCPATSQHCDDVEGRGRRRDLVRLRQRRVRDGRLGARPEDRRQGAHAGRRQRRFAKATGLTLDLTARGMGVRSNRYSMLVKDGVVRRSTSRRPGKFEVSDADTLLKQVGCG